MIKFFRKNIIDLSNSLATFTVTDPVATNTGEDFTYLMQNRNNNSGWATTGSTDAAGTTMVVSFGGLRTFDSIHLVGHNLKSFTLKYWNGSAWTNFSTPIAETANTASTNYYNFTSVEADQIQLVISGTQVADTDKYIKQFIVTEIIGTLSVQPEVRPQWDKDRKVTKFLSGKNFVAKSVGGFNCQVRMKVASNDADFAVIESLFNTYEGFLVWLCGGDESQFTDGVREGYRLEDIFLMDLSNEYAPEYNDSRWAHGMSFDLKLVEVA